jgi:hypothetical protein
MFQYTIGLGTKIDENTPQKVAHNTGAKYYNAVQDADLIALYEIISKQLSGQYSNSNSPDVGSKRRVQLAYKGLKSEKEYKVPIKTQTM